MKDSNIGLTGIDSLRINNLKIDNLPLGQGNAARDGLAAFLKTDKETKEAAIRAKYPTQRVDYLLGVIKEAEGNIKRIKKFKQELKEKISEYRQLIKDAIYRDTELAKYNIENPDESEKIKELKRKYPPYNIDALNEQIVQFEEAIDRCDKIIEDDYESISNVKSVLTLVEQRDRELKEIK